jgi:preprotein translocase subunit YajC
MILAAARQARSGSGFGMEIFMIILIVALIVMMWLSSRKQKKTQQQRDDWRNNLKPGDKVATVSGLLGTIKEADPAHDQVVIDSEGSLSRWRIQAIVKPPVIPHYADEDNNASENNNASADSSENTHTSDGQSADVQSANTQSTDTQSDSSQSSSN